MPSVSTLSSPPPPDSLRNTSPIKVSRCSSGSPRPFPYIPPELVIRIFEFAVSDSHESARSISLVSKWARKIALPHLFHTLVYRVKPAYSAGMTSGARTSPNAREVQSSAWGHFVRNLWTESTGIANSSNEGDLFRACPNVENLALRSSSLRALVPTGRRNEAVSNSGSSQLLFPSRLRAVTLITHTFRYDWHFLVGFRLQDGTELLHNITHLRILDMTISSFSPHNLMPNLTHLALPYLDLGNDFTQDRLHLPPSIMEHQMLRMIVLTVAEGKWLTNPWYQIALYPGKGTTSPKKTFRNLVQWARQRDDRLHVVLSPRLGEDSCQEWVDAARGGHSIWDAAAKARAEDLHGEGLPDTYPKGLVR